MLFYKREDFLKELFIGVCLLALAFFLYTPNIPEWWMADDTQILTVAASHPFWEYFAFPSAWQELSSKNLTPWVLALYDLDFFLFGLSPALFYRHHLFIFGLLIVTIYLFLRRWLSPMWSFVAGIFFVLSPAFANNVYLLMTRHYVEGLLWSLWAIFFYLKALRDQRPVLGYWGALFYLAAVLCKEIYVPLVLMLPFWPRKDLDKRKSEYIPVIRERLSYFLPFVVVAGLYSLYRRWMLGHWLGEYRGLYPAQTDIETLLNNTGHLMLGDAAWLATIILPFVLLGLWSSRFGKFKNICFAFLVLLLVAGPLVPLMKISGVLTERHFFLPAFILSIAVSLGGSLLWRLGQAGRFAGLVGIAVIFLGLFQANQGVQKELGDLSHKYSSVGRFLWSESDACDALFV